MFFLLSSEFNISKFRPRHEIQVICSTNWVWISFLSILHFNKHSLAFLFSFCLKPHLCDSGKLSWEQVLKYARLRKRYISLYASLLRSDPNRAVVEDNKDIEELDRELDIELILQWRYCPFFCFCFLCVKLLLLLLRDSSPKLQHKELVSYQLSVITYAFHSLLLTIIDDLTFSVFFFFPFVCRCA